MTSPTIAFRVDASTEIGTGHLMRCLTLAQSLRSEGADCTFLGRRHGGQLGGLIEERGFSALTLDTFAAEGVDTAMPAARPVHAAWLGTSWRVDAAQTLAALGNTCPDWLVVDHYALDAHWERLLRSRCHRLLVIDDLADRPHDCDLLLDQNLGRQASDYAGLVPKSARVLAGPEFALLRPEFAKMRETSARRRRLAPWRRILVTMGGVDQLNVTGRTLAALARCALPQDCKVTVVMGAAAPWLAHVRTQARQLPYAAEVLVNVLDMARHLSETDIAIGAAGSSAWERCCLGVPTITAVLADNQRSGATALASAGAALLLPENGDIDTALASSLAVLAEDAVLQRMQDVCLSITDGLGTQRLAQEMLHA